MTDSIDRAQDREAEFTEERLAAQREAAALERAGSEACRDCGEPIRPERRAALPSATRCLECQEWFERLGERI